MPLEQLDNGVKILADEMQVAVHLPNGRAMKISKETYFQSWHFHNLPIRCVGTSDGTLLRDNRRLIGRSLIVLARKVQNNRD